jgi:Polyketide cyclase / dehydrase and lipid transport
MNTWTTDAHLTRPPREVMELLTEPESIAGWSPVPFEVLELDGQRLTTGSRARVRGRLARRDVEFSVDVLEARDGRLALTAEGPISLEVEYVLCSSGAGSDIRASVSVYGRGLLGRLLAGATDALLRGGALNGAIARLASSLEPAIAA